MEADRRGVLKNLAALGAAAPLTGVLSCTRARPAQAQAPAALSSRQLAGQRVIYSYSGLTVPAALRQAITAGRAAGVIFFGGNISSEAQISSVIRQLILAQQQSPVSAPLLLMTDQEGGEVRRLPGAPALSQKQIGEFANPAAAASQAGTGAGQNLARVGMNVNLAPVLDVYYQSGNFIDQYQRSYSNQASVVASCGQAVSTAQQQTSVAATAKPFPGLGAATNAQNTDTGPVTLTVPLSELRAKDEAPYPAAIAARVQLIMVSWAIYPALDATRPAAQLTVHYRRGQPGRVGGIQRRVDGPGRHDELYPGGDGGRIRHLVDGVQLRQGHGQGDRAGVGVLVLGG